MILCCMPLYCDLFADEPRVYPLLRVGNKKLGWNFITAITFFILEHGLD